MDDQDDRPARSTSQLLGNFWALFHHAWGLALEGRYSKRTIAELQEIAHELFERVGLERRRRPRGPGDPPIRRP